MGFKTPGREPTFNQLIKNAKIRKAPLEDFIGGAHLLRGEEVAGALKYIKENKGARGMALKLRAMRRQFLGAPLDSIICSDRIPWGPEDVVLMIQQFNVRRNAAIVDSILNKKVNRHLDETCAGMLAVCAQGGEAEERFEYLSILALYASFLPAPMTGKCRDSLVASLNAEKDAAMQIAITYALTLLLDPRAVPAIISASESHGRTHKELAFYKSALILAVRLENRQIGGYISRFIHGRYSPQLKASALLALLSNPEFWPLVSAYTGYVTDSTAEILGISMEGAEKHPAQLKTVFMSIVEQRVEGGKRRILEENGLADDWDAIRLVGKLLAESDYQAGYPAGRKFSDA